MKIANLFIITLKICFIFILKTILLGSCTNHNGDIVFENFEDETFNKWEVQGTAFDKPYLADTISDTLLNNSIFGNQFAYSYINDTVLNQGKLISPKFKINHKYIDFLIGGGNHSTRTCINLIIDNKIVRTQTGLGKPVLSKASWDVTEYIGQHAIIEIVDAMHYSYDDLDYIMVDNIVFSNHKPRPTIVFEDFESGNFENWQVEGNAFKEPGNRSNIYYPITVNGFEGKFFAFSFGENHDKETGRLISEQFIIDRNYIHFLIGGGNHKDSTCVNLIVNDSVYFSATGLKSGEMRKVIWNVSHLKGKKVHIEIVDDYSGYWGHIIVDNICFADTVGADVASLPYHKLWSKLIYALAFILIIGVLIFIFLYKRKQQTPTRANSLSDKDFHNKMVDLLENDKIFLQADLSAKAVAMNFNISTNEFLNKTDVAFKMPFNDLINEYRVNYFKEEVLRSENRGLKLVAIAERCGFNSKSSFYRIFKKHTNITPTEYLQKKKG